MGNDGGSIPTRRELVKEAARHPTSTELKATQTESQAHHWSHDPLSQRPLAKPIVSDSNGRLYNKDSILEFLLPSDDEREEGVKSKADKVKVTAGAVKSLKDVVEVRFDVDTEASQGKSESWKCPITSARLGPGSKAVYLVPCGHAFSGAAIKEVAVDGSKCLVCDATYAQNDVIPILPTAKADTARLQLRAKSLRDQGLTHSLKKAARAKEKGHGKKRKNRVGDADTDADADAAAKQDAELVPALVVANSNTADASNIRNSSTASLTARVMAEQEKNKKRRMDNANLQTLFSSRDPAKPHGRSSDFMTRGFDIPAGAKR